MDADIREEIDILKAELRFLADALRRQDAVLADLTGHRCAHAPHHSAQL